MRLSASHLEGLDGKTDRCQEVFGDTKGGKVLYVALGTETRKDLIKK